MKDLSEILTIERKRNNMTQRALGINSHVTPATINQIEIAGCIPSPHILNLLAESLGIDPMRLKRAAVNEKTKALKRKYLS